MYGTPIVPADFVVPRGVETALLRLRPLTVHDAVKDHDAVMTSAGRLRTLFRPAPSGATGARSVVSRPKPLRKCVPSSPPIPKPAPTPLSRRFSIASIP